MRRPIPLLALLVLASAPAALAQPATAPGVGRFPHVEVDPAAREVRIACEALAVEMPLEFLCVAANGPDHESLLRTQARPSDIHAALLMLGLEPGRPVRYVQPLDKWLPPTGPAVRADVTFERQGESVRLPVERLIRNRKTGQPADPQRFVFVGSRIMPDGLYAADGTGYIVSLVNFDLTVLDVPQLASNANETLELERDPDAAPPAGTPVTLILRPLGEAPPAVTRPAGEEPVPQTKIDMPLIKIAADGTLELDRLPVALDELTRRLRELAEQRPLRVRISAAPDAPDNLLRQVEQAVRAADVGYSVVPPSVRAQPFDPATADRIADLRAQWQRQVAPHRDHLRSAAAAHEQILRSLRQEQLRLLEEADRIGTEIQLLEREYEEMTAGAPR